MNIDYDNIETNEILDILNKYKKGTRFIITGEPSTWSSSLNNNCPLTFGGGGASYPYHGRIIETIEYKDHVAMTDGVYGWNLSELINTDNIILINDMRKQKLDKINDNQKNYIL